MRRIKNYNKKNKNAMNKILFIVFFCVIVCSFSLFLIYSNKTSKKAVLLIEQKIDKIVYQFFSDLITNDVINKESVNDILEINKNNNGEILSVSYDLEKTYKILTDVSTILKNGINDLENGKINITLYDKYIKASKKGLILDVPVFLGIDNIYLNNIGPKIPVIVNFNESLLTNIKTKVTDYGFNNALLELYITVEIQKLIITPVKKSEEKFYYDILIGALVVNGRMPNFYGGSYETSSQILDIPIN